MRIAVVHSFYTARQPSGENNVVLDQVEQLERAGHVVRLIARHTDDLAAQRLYSVRAALVTATGVGASPDAALDEFSPDVVHVHNTFPNWGTSWLRRWQERTVITAHNYRPMCAAGTLFRDGHDCTDCLRVPALPAVRYGCYRGSAVASIPLALASSPVGPLRRIMRQACRVITLNDHAREVYARVLRRAVDLVPNFVPPAAATAAAPSRGWAYIGRLTREKGIDRLVDSWPSGEALEIIGHGPLADEVTERAGEKSNVVVVGLLPRDELLARLGTYRGLVLPSLWSEGLPTIVLEGLARGVPSVLSRHIAASRFLHEAGVASVFDPDRATEELDTALRSVVEADGSIRDACVELHQREYSPSVWQSRVDALYRAVATGHPHRT